MNIHQSFAAPPPAKPRVSGDRGALLTALVHLWPYIWPSDRRDLKLRVLLATGLLFLAKLATMAVPFTFKWATDALVAASGGNVPSGQTLSWLIGAPVLATVLYGLTRVAMTLLVQVREGMFAKVALETGAPETMARM